MDGSFNATNEESHSPTITTRIIGNKLRLMASWTDRMGTPFLIEDDYKDLLPPLGKGANSWKSQNVTNQNSIEQTPLKIYPNPFNPNTKISYELNDDSYVIVEVFDVLGRKIKTLVDCKKEAGFYSVIFDASHLKSGIYFARLTVRQQDNNLIVNTIKLLLTK